MSRIPDEFYLYLAQKGYTNTCRGYSYNDSTGGYVVPNVQVDTCRFKKNEIYFNVSYPLIKSRFEPSVDGFFGKRDPTVTIHAIYDATGGDETFKRNYDYYTQGTYDPDAKVLGNDSIFHRSYQDRYVTDTEMQSAFKYNMWVNESGVFKMDNIEIPVIISRGSNYPPHKMPAPEVTLSSSFTNHLVGCLIKGVGYENIEFPLNGHISNMLKDAGIVKDALTKFYNDNKGKKNELKTFSGQINGTTINNNFRALILKGVSHPDTLIGSGFITVSQYNEKEILVRIFDIKSIYSGDFLKEARRFGINNGVPVSLVRDSTKEDNRYTNTSQTYSFTLPIDFERLEQGK
ncbi:hypothetical protein LJC72_13560 [Bacteroides sp. OttesenSCG-928-D19]|nr:hypothetical protein [Bacteroides sp. OttesenSCG-928-D19]